MSIFVHTFKYFLHSSHRNYTYQVKDILLQYLEQLYSKTRNYLRLFSTNTLPTGWLTPVGAVNRECCSSVRCSSVMMSSSSTPSSLAYCSSAGWVLLKSGEVFEKTDHPWRKAHIKNYHGNNEKSPNSWAWKYAGYSNRSAMNANCLYFCGPRFTQTDLLWTQTACISVDLGFLTEKTVTGWMRLPLA